MSDVTQIYPPELTKVGAGVEGVAARLDRFATEVDGWSYRSQDAVRGSRMCNSGLSSTAWQWSAILATMAAEIRDLGGSMRKTAADFETADAVAQERLRASGHPAFAPNRGW